MMFRYSLLVGAVALAAATGAALAQLNEPDKGFYANPVFADPVMPRHVVPPTQTNAGVAVVSQVRKPTTLPPCNAQNPCAMLTPARG